jgi:hypothetical protein
MRQTAATTRHGSIQTKIWQTKQQRAEFKIEPNIRNIPSKGGADLAGEMANQHAKAASQGGSRHANTTDDNYSPLRQGPAQPGLRKPTTKKETDLPLHVDRARDAYQKKRAHMISHLLSIAQRSSPSLPDIRETTGTPNHPTNKPTHLGRRVASAMGM